LTFIENTEFSINGNPILIDEGGLMASFLNDHPLMQVFVDLVSSSGIPNARIGSRNGRGQYVGLSMPKWPEMPDLGVNEMYWPTGASRFAIGCFLVSGASIPDSLPLQNTVLLNLQTGHQKRGQFYPIWKKLTSVGGDEESVYLMYLVDERFFWQFYDVGNMDLTEDSSWGDVFQKIASSIGQSITTDTIASAYLKPDVSEVDRKYENAGAMLDAVSSSVGQRIIRAWDGSVSSRGWNAIEGDPGEGTQNIADGEWSVISGGPNAQPVPPGQYHVVFQGLIDHVDCPEPKLYEKSSSLQFSGTWTQVINSSAYANYDIDNLGGTPLNDVVLDALAEKIAVDHSEKSSLSGYDIIFAGIQDLKIDARRDFEHYRIGCVSHGSLSITTRTKTMPYDSDPETQLSQDPGLRVLKGSEHIGVVTSAGITAFNPETNKPGEGGVVIWSRNVSGQLEPTGITKEYVYNWSKKEIKPNEGVSFYIDDYCTAWVGPGSVGDVMWGEVGTEVTAWTGTCTSITVSRRNSCNGGGNNDNTELYTVVLPRIDKMLPGLKPGDIIAFAAVTTGTEGSSSGSSSSQPTEEYVCVSDYTIPDNGTVQWGAALSDVEEWAEGGCTQVVVSTVDSCDGLVSLDGLLFVVNLPEIEGVLPNIHTGDVIAFAGVAKSDSESTNSESSVDVTDYVCVSAYTKSDSFGSVKWAYVSSDANAWGVSECTSVPCTITTDCDGSAGTVAIDVILPEIDDAIPNLSRQDVIAYAEVESTEEVEGKTVTTTKYVCVSAYTITHPGSGGSNSGVRPFTLKADAGVSPYSATFSDSCDPTTDFSAYDRNNLYGYGCDGDAGYVAWISCDQRWEIIDFMCDDGTDCGS
tara:strand:+ start:5877 stop:8456 length:2580 start_codon:yes stop_codon:yes gene_type:complete